MNKTATTSNIETQIPRKNQHPEVKRDKNDRVRKQPCIFSRHYSSLVRFGPVGSGTFRNETRHRGLYKWLWRWKSKCTNLATNAEW